MSMEMEKFGLVQNKLPKLLMNGDNSTFQSRFVFHKIVTCGKVEE